MTDFNHNAITVVRGDTVAIQLVIYTPTGIIYTPTENDKVVFFLSKKPSKQYNEIGNKLLLKKEFNSTNGLIITPDDTLYLDSDKYYYNVEITMVDGDKINKETVVYGTFNIIY